MNTQIEIVDGPLAGRCHELEFGWPTPTRLGLRSEDRRFLYWHNVRDGRAYWTDTEHQVE